jgi:mevalonate kinase
MLVGEYAALAEGSTVEAAFGCYAKAQFIPQMDTVMTLVSEIIARIKSEVAEVGAALPPGSVLLTNAYSQGAVPVPAGLGTGAAMAVAAVGAVMEALGLPLEARKPLVFRIADAARRAAQGYVGSGSDTAAAAYGGLIRTGRGPDGQRLVVPMAPPAGLHLVVFAAGPALAPAEVVRALERHARTDAVSFLEAVARLRGATQRFLDEVAAGQATAAIAAAGKYGEILQGLCAAAEAPIMNPAFTRAAELAHEFGGVAKPVGAGGGEIGVALFATPEAVRRFQQACTDPLAVLSGDLDYGGVRCEFADNAIAADLDEQDSADFPDSDPDEFDMPTVKEPAPIELNLHEAVTARNPTPAVAPLAEPEPPAEIVAPRRRPVLWVLALVVALGGGLGIYRLLRSRPANAPVASPVTAPVAAPATATEPSVAPTGREPPLSPPPPAAAPATAHDLPVAAPAASPTASAQAKAARAQRPSPALSPKRRPAGRAVGGRAPASRAGNLSPDDF